MSEEAQIEHEDDRHQNECVADSMFGIQQRLMAIQRERVALTDALELYRSRVGKVECLSIIKYHINVSEVTNTIKRLQDSMGRISHMPLIRFINEDGVRYSVVLARMDQIIVGEYENIEDVMAKMEPDKALNLRNNVNAMEERLLANSIDVYDSLATHAKKTGRGNQFRGLVTSNKRKYLYHYLPDKKRVLGFVAVRLPKRAE